MRILDNVYMVGSGNIGLSNAYDCHMYLIDGGNHELALVDAGVGLESNRIFGNIRAHNFDPKNIVYVLTTHSHSDHAGGCRNLKAETSCGIIASEAEARLMEKGTDEELGLIIAKKSGCYPLDYAYPHCKVDKTIRNQENLRVGNCQVRAICVPGHSLGSTCYLLEQDNHRVLFSGDTVFFNGIIGLLNCYGSSLEAYRENMGKLSNLGIDALMPGHGLFTVRGGQAHIDKAVEALQELFVPQCMGR